MDFIVKGKQWKKMILKINQILLDNIKIKIKNNNNK